MNGKNSKKSPFVYYLTIIVYRKTEVKLHIFINPPWFATGANDQCFKWHKATWIKNPVVIC